ncbi:RNA polymerase-associated protein rtf1, partial [Coelomomyces lativittatus]
MSDDNLSNEILAFIEGNHSVNDFSSSPLSDTSATSKKPTTKSEHTESSKRSKKSKPKKNVYSKSSDSEALDDEESWSDVPEESDRFPPPFSDQFKNSLDSSKETTFPPPPIQLEDDDDDAYEDKWDSDLMGGESDREYLQSLPELEREKILNERAEKRQMVLERKALKKKLRESGLAVFEDSTKRANRSKSEKRQKLEALKGQREEKRRKHESAPSQTRPMHRSAPFSNIEAVHDVNDELVQSPLSTSGSQESTFDFTLDHLRKLQVTRHQIKNWCFASFFEKSVIGAFVRINVGDHNGECIYRVAQIKDIQKYKRTYKIDNLVTNKALVLAHGKAVREFLADIVSNQPITE